MTPKKFGSIAELRESGHASHVSLEVQIEKIIKSMGVMHLTDGSEDENPLKSFSSLVGNGLKEGAYITATGHYCPNPAGNDYLLLERYNVQTSIRDSELPQ